MPFQRGAMGWSMIGLHVTRKPRLRIVDHRKHGVLQPAEKSDQRFDQIRWHENGLHSFGRGSVADGGAIGKNAQAAEVE